MTLRTDAMPTDGVDSVGSRGFAFSRATWRVGTEPTMHGIHGEHLAASFHPPAPADASGGLTLPLVSRWPFRASIPRGFNPTPPPRAPGAAV